MSFQRFFLNPCKGEMRITFYAIMDGFFFRIDALIHEKFYRLGLSILLGLLEVSNELRCSWNSYNCKVLRAGDAGSNGNQC